MTHCIDKLELISYCSGDCSEERTAQIEKHVAGCVSCRGYLKQLEEERRRFLTAHPFESMPPAKQNRIVPFPSARAFALAASIAFLAIGGYVLNALYPATGTHRIKGDTGISLYVKATDGTIESRENHVYHPGERIQITYSCGERNHLILLSIDQEGRISTYYPVDGDTSLVLEKGRGIPLPNSIELDSYLGNELYIAAFSESALSLPDVVAKVRAAYDRAGALSGMQIALRSDTAVRTLMITKQEATQ